MIKKIAQIKTIDVIAKEWHDRKAGNSYFAAQVTFNYGMKNAMTFHVPFQNGYGEHYLEVSFSDAMKQFGVIKKIPRYFCAEHSIILRNHIERNCRRAEVESHGAA